jgi:hypothetical protein
VEQPGGIRAHGLAWPVALLQYHRLHPSVPEKFVQVAVFGAESPLEQVRSETQYFSFPASGSQPHNDASGLEPEDLLRVQVCSRSGWDDVNGDRKVVFDPSFLRSKKVWLNARTLLVA